MKKSLLTKYDSFKNPNTANKLSARLNKQKRNTTQIININNERGHIAHK
jgi:capsular polysaccharide biosynthesis protein